MYVQNTQDYTDKLLELINEFIKVAGYKTNMQHLLVFLVLATNNQKVR